MLLIERKILDHLEKNKNILFFVMISLLGFAIRQAGRDFISNDMQRFLIPWYEMIREQGGFPSLRVQVGDYNLLYQTIIAALTYLPGDCVIYYKAVSILFDYWMAVSAAVFTSKLAGSEKFGTAFQITYASILLLPTVILNSAYWGQCDSIYTTFMILTLMDLYEEKYPQAFFMLGLGFAVKLQTVFLLPFLLVYYVYKKKFSIFCFLLSLLSFYGSGIVAFLYGRSFAEPFRIYIGQTGLYKHMYLNVSSFWVLLGDHYSELGKFALILTIALCGLGLYLVLASKLRIDSADSFIGAAIGFVWLCILFLPAMHERYTYPLDILLLILAAVDRKYLKYAVVSELLSLSTYGAYLFGTGGVTCLHAVLFTAAWLYYVYEQMHGRREKI